MKSPVSLVRTWLASSAPTNRVADVRQAPEQTSSTGRSARKASPQLSRLPARRHTGTPPAISAASTSSPKVSGRTSADPELHDAIKAIRAGAQWSPSTSRRETASATSPNNQGAAPSIPPGDGWGMTFLHQAEHRAEVLDMVWQHDFSSERLDEILAKHPDFVNAVDHHGDPLLVSALGCDNFRLAKALVAHGANVNAQDSVGNTPLHTVAGRDTALLEQLLEAGADVHATNNQGATPLFNARSAQAVDMLVRAGAPIDARDARGNTAVMRLAQAANKDTVLAMLAHNPDLRTPNGAGRTFARVLTMRFGGSPDTIPKTGVAAKAFLELAKRETWIGNLRDRKSLPSDAATANTRRSGLPTNPLAELRVAPDVQVPPATARAAKPAINNLKSGHKINLVHDALRTFDELPDRDASALSEALGFGALSSEDANVRGQQRDAIRETFSKFAKEIGSDFRNYSLSAIEHPALSGALTEAEHAELVSAMRVAHISLALEPARADGADGPQRVRMFFGGTQNFRDVRQDISSAFGRIGDVDRATKRAGELFAKILSRPNHVELDFISGASMGGAMAQSFRATVESRILLPRQPSMILLDPQLLNNNQGRRATRGGPLDVDYGKPRGVAVTLDYARAPHRGLMGIMKGPGGYRYPGLVQLKLGLTDTDGYNGKRPQTSGPPGLGYHADAHQFAAALSRFSVDREDAVMDNPAFDAVRAPRWARQQGPVLTSSTLPAVARRGRHPMESIAEDGDASL